MASTQPSYTYPIEEKGPLDLNFNDLDLDNLDISSLGSFQNQLQNLEIGPLSQPQSMNASAQNSVNNPSLNYNPYQIPSNQYPQHPQHIYPPHINGNNQSPDGQSNGHSGSNGKIPNGQNGQIYHQQQPQQPQQQQQTEAKKIFEEKYKEAIENKIASNNSSSTNSSIKSVHAKIVAPTNIHPQHKSQTIKAVPSQQYVTTLNNNNNNNNIPYGDEGDWMDDDDDHNDLLARFDAPSVNVKTEENPPSSYYNTAHSPTNHQHIQPTLHHNGHTCNAHNGHNGHLSTKGPYGWNDGNLAAPTPRGYNPNIMDATPKGNYAPRTPARTPRIQDPMLIQNILQSIAYYADKLDQLHSEYRAMYQKQQTVNQKLQSLDPSSMNHTDYQNYSSNYQTEYFNISQTLQMLILNIYEQFTKMKEALSRRNEVQLDQHRRSQFERFQRYYDQFASTQAHLIDFARQQYQQQKVREEYEKQQRAYQYPETPMNHRQNLADQYSQYYGRQSTQYLNHARNLNITSKTPRGTFVNTNQSQRYGAYPQHAHTTNGTDNSRKFQWGSQAQRPQNQIQKPSMTPRGMMQHTQQQQQQQQQLKPKMNNNNNNNKTSGDIPNMGYVYIGSRMSQLISHIGLSDREVEENQNRIKSSIADILKSEKNFAGFDVVEYGSSSHKLFIKDYSDFDFCIRCKKLGMSHDEAVEYIATTLSETKKTQFENVKIIDCIKDSVHGYNIKNINHISFFDKKSGRSVDLVLNNLPEIGSSRFIAAYESIDPRFALLCRVVKYWAQQRKINSPLNGTLSTYSLVLMVINFLQLRRVLPTLSIMVDRSTGLSPWSTQDDFQINVQKYRDFASKNEEPHSRLLVNFFHFYGHKFEFAKDVVSVRTGTYLRKSERNWNVENDHFCCVENPFDSRTNLTRNVDDKNLKRIDDEFKRAYKILCESYKIYEVCKLAE